jgi:membrane-associated phospholipid phosphatase
MTTLNRPVARRHRVLLLAGLTLLACAAAFAAVMRASSGHLPVTGMDRGWLSIVSSTRNAPLTGVFKVLSLICGPDGATVIVAVLCIVLTVVRRWRTALYLALAEACGSSCSDLIKLIVHRHRPPHPLVAAAFSSFPSGHVITTIGVGVALTMVFVRPGRRAPVLAAVAAAVLLMMYCRTYLAAHWLSDTLESLPVGTGVALLLWWFFEPVIDHDRGLPLRRGRAESAMRRDASADAADAATHLGTAG